MNIVEMLIVAAATDSWVKAWEPRERASGRSKAYRTAKYIALRAILP